MITGLKRATANSLIWSAFDKFGVQSWNFIIGLLLARKLFPADYGLIGMLSIFIAVSQTLIDSGMASGLIQKKNKNDADFSTVFIFNMVVSLAIYLILFLSAPLIADFYTRPELTKLTRVLCLTIIINALAIVQRTKINIRLDFKAQAQVNAISVVLGGLSALYLAYRGLGVWALVAQQLAIAITAVMAYHYFSDWKPSLIFSRNSFRELFGFGSKLLAVGLYGQILNNTYNMAIGKVYPASQLGFYTRARDLAEMSAGVITNIFYSISYPLFSSLQGEPERMLMVFKRMLRLASFINFPLMAMLAVLADPFIRLAMGEKWLAVIPLVQLAAFSRILYPISSLNLTILNSIGRSDLFLKVDIIKIPLIIISLLITIPLGIQAILIGQIITAFLAFAINAYLPGKLFGFGILPQLKEVLPIIFSTILMAAVSVVAMTLFTAPIAKILAGGAVGAGVYIFMASLFKVREIDDVRDLIREKLLSR